MNRLTNTILIMAAFTPSYAAGQVCAKQISVPEYPPIAVAAQLTGAEDLTITVGAQGTVVRVEGSGSPPILVDIAKENVKEWIFCDPNKNPSAHVRLRFDYRIKGARTYPVPPAKVVIDLGTGTIVITSAPGKVET